VVAAADSETVTRRVAAAPWLCQCFQVRRTR
jgi:hypothetical protein